MTISRDGLCAQEATRLIPPCSTPHPGTNTIVPFVKARVHRQVTQRQGMSLQIARFGCPYWLFTKRVGPRSAKYKCSLRDVSVSLRPQSGPDPLSKALSIQILSIDKVAASAEPNIQAWNEHQNALKVSSRHSYPFALDRSCQGNLCG
jgi:hypothetical protein